MGRGCAGTDVDHSESPRFSYRGRGDASTAGWCDGAQPARRLFQWVVARVCRPSAGSDGHAGRRGIKVHSPSGAYYVMADIARFGMTDTAFAKYLVEHIGVAAVPASSFYLNPWTGFHKYASVFVKNMRPLRQRGKNWLDFRAGNSRLAHGPRWFPVRGWTHKRSDVMLPDFVIPETTVRESARVPRSWWMNTEKPGSF